MKGRILSYLIISVLVFLVLARGCRDKSVETITKIDTLVVYDTVKEIIQGKTVFIKSKIDTSIWVKKADLKPDTTYNGLLHQYMTLGNKHYSINTFETEFKIGDYGTVVVSDSIQENWLKSSIIKTNLTIPTTTITVEKQAPPSIQLYIGPRIYGNKLEPISGVYGDISLKTKKDRLYNFSVGYNGEIQYGLGVQYKIKLK